MTSKEKNVEVRVQADLVEASGTERPSATAYAYSRGGRLLARKPLDDKGAATLSVSVDVEPTSVRLLVGPAVEEPELDDLLRRGAQEQHLRVDPSEPRLSVKLSVASPIWKSWLFGSCVVKGTLVKRVTTGGVPLDLPVCHASVDVYEVDPLYRIVSDLPDLVIDRIRELIVRPVPPFPDPPPFRAAAASPVARAVSEPQLDPDTVNALQQASASSDLRFLAQAGSRLQFQKALLDRAELLRPILCFYYPRLLTMRKVATAQTDECGHFQTLFFKGFHDTDVPDLYFKARQRVFGLFEITIYAPTPIACHTWWDYACGTQVRLVTTHPLAVTCAPCPPVIGPDNWVLFTAIGNTSLKAIFGGGAAGATAGNRGLLDSGAPWGGVLRPRLDFDSSLRESLGVRYYQLSWRRGTSGDWEPLNAEVNRHYTHVVGGELVLEPYRLGPNHRTVGTQNLELYEIPPAVPPIGHWTVANAILDTENGEFDSTTHARGLAFDEDGTVVAGSADESGLYQLKLDLYDAAGQLVDIAAKQIRYVVPDSASLTGVIHTVQANMVAQPGGGTLVQGNSLVLTLHVDNNRCWADLGAPVTPAGTADACCGVVPYGPGATMTLPYTAFHPHGFATHSLKVFRSATQILPTITGTVGSFTVTRSVGDLMSLALPAECAGKPPCTLAAFAADLEVQATATDGWGGLGYGDEDDRAFALEPA